MKKLIKRNLMAYALAAIAVGSALPQCNEEEDNEEEGNEEEEMVTLRGTVEDDVYHQGMYLGRVRFGHQWRDTEYRIQAITYSGSRLLVRVLDDPLEEGSDRRLGVSKETIDALVSQGSVIEVRVSQDDCYDCAGYNCFLVYASQIRVVQQPTDRQQNCECEEAQERKR